MPLPRTCLAAQLGESPYAPTTQGLSLYPHKLAVTSGESTGDNNNTTQHHGIEATSIGLSDEFHEGGNMTNVNTNSINLDFVLGNNVLVEEVFAKNGFLVLSSVTGEEKTAEANADQVYQGEGDDDSRHQRMTTDKKEDEGDEQEGPLT